MATSYAEISDIRAAGYPLAASQEAAAKTLIEQASAKLRLTAREFGKSIDDMIADEETGEDYALAVKSVVVQVVCRGLNSAQTNSGGLSQGSFTLGSYTVQQTFAQPGQSVYFLNSELRDLGLFYEQTMKAVEVFATDDTSGK